MNASRRRSTSLLFALLAGIGLATAACGGGADSAAVHAPAASPHTAAEKAATLNWLDQTNQMWTTGDFAALDQVTTGEIRTVYQVEQQHATLPTNADRLPLQLTGLSVTIPCQVGGDALFVAYGDTDVFTLGQGMQPYAMVFQRIGGSWKLAAAVQYPSGGAGWPTLCSQGTATTAPAVLAPDRYVADLARVLTHAMTGTQPTTVTASPSRSTDSCRVQARSTAKRPPGSARTGEPRSASPGTSLPPRTRRSRCRWPTAAATG